MHRGQHCPHISLHTQQALTALTMVEADLNSIRVALAQGVVTTSLEVVEWLDSFDFEDCLQ